MRLHGSLFVETDERVAATTYTRQHDGGLSHWVSVGAVGIHCDDAATADRLSAAFAELAARMRAKEAPTHADPASGVELDHEVLGVSRTMNEGARERGAVIVTDAELRELARAFDGIARTLRQGAPYSEYLKGLAAMASVSAQSLYMLAAVGSAKEVTIPDPEYTETKGEQA